MRRSILTLHFILSFFNGPVSGHAGEKQSYYCDDIRTPFFITVPGTGILHAARARSEADDFIMPKPPKWTRVFIVGESVAKILGSGVPVEAAGDRLEIINCGMGGYESYRIHGVLEEVLRYQPDLIVLLSGNNETLREPCPGFSAEMRRRWRRLLERFYSIRPSDMPAQTKASLKIHEQRIRAMAAAARRKKTPLVICALPANLLMPPNGELPLKNSVFAQGFAAFEKKDYSSALKYFLLFAEESPSDQFAQYYSGLSLRAAGRNEDALKYLRTALDLSGGAGPARNEMLRRVATEEGACFADLERVFKAASPYGIPGFDQFTDGMHWRSFHESMVWDAIFSAAGSCGINAAQAYRGTAPMQSKNAEWDAPEKRISYAVSWLDDSIINERVVAELSYLLKKNPAVLKKAVSSAQGLAELVKNDFRSAGLSGHAETRYPAFLTHAAEAYRRSGRVGQALKLMEKAMKSKTTAIPAAKLRPGIRNIRNSEKFSDAF